MRMTLFTFSLVFGKIKTSKSAIEIIAITLPRQRGKGIKRKSFVADLSRLFVTGYSKVSRCYEWLNQNYLSTERGLPKC